MIPAKPQIVKLFGLTDEAYNNNVLEYSFMFLERKGYNKTVIEALHQTNAYWIWWQNQYNIADHFFMNCYRVYHWQSRPLAQLADMYRRCHIESAIYPDRIIEKINHRQLIKK